MNGDNCDSTINYFPPRAAIRLIKCTPRAACANVVREGVIRNTIPGRRLIFFPPPRTHPTASVISRRAVAFMYLCGCDPSLRIWAKRRPRATPAAEKLTRPLLFGAEAIWIEAAFIDCHYPLANSRAPPAPALTDWVSEWLAVDVLIQRLFTGAHGTMPPPPRLIIILNYGARINKRRRPATDRERVICERSVCLDLLFMATVLFLFVHCGYFLPRCHFC